MLQFADSTHLLSWPLLLCIKTMELHTPGIMDSSLTKTIVTDVNRRHISPYRVHLDNGSPLVFCQSDEVPCDYSIGSLRWVPGDYCSCISLSSPNYVGHRTWCCGMQDHRDTIAAPQVQRFITPRARLSNLFRPSVCQSVRR